ncbi:putative 3' like protein [Argiope bruennichi]|uniref:3',5'-cyclic-GMP phosphodiesterase n=1 Tax=Argiope bruennichi TaxID=94029 RepID=A0A8T0FP89_ARGBR|nr:putative 3' like protein [Argiope bruennichi]
MEKGKKLTDRERGQIEALSSTGMSSRAIAIKIGRSKTVVNNFFKLKDNYGKKNTGERPKAFSSRDERRVCQLASTGKSDFVKKKEFTICSQKRLDRCITVKVIKTKAGYHMYRPKGTQGRLPPLLSVSPVGGRHSSKYQSRSPSASASKYHSKCCLPTRPPSPGPGEYLEGLSCKISVRSSRSSRTAKRHTRPQSQDWSQIVTDYLKKHEEFLEEYILENIPLDLLERLVIRKIRRQGQYAEEMAETNEVVPNLSRWKFCVHADKREMLQELTSTLFSYPNKIRVLTELANTVASAVNASDWRLHIYDADTKKLCSFGSDNECLNDFQIEDTLADYVMKTKETVRCKSTDRDNRFPEGVSINLDKPVYVLCHPVLQPDEELSGVLELYKDASDVEFHEEDEEIVNSYLVWGGIALHYAELYVNMMKQRELNMFLLTVVKSIFQDMISMDTVILKIMMFARKLVSADRASLFLVDGRSSELYARIFDVSSSENEDENLNDKKEVDLKPQEIRFPMGKGIAGYVAMTGESLNIPDAYNDSRFNRSVDQRTGYNTRNLLCMPIFIRGSVIGVVQMVNKTSGAFTKSDEEDFATFAIYCGLALHHAKLYDKIRRSEQKHKLALEILSYHNTCSEEELDAIKAVKIPIDVVQLQEYSFSADQLNSDEKVVASIFMLTDLPQIQKVMKIDHDSLVRFTLTVRKNYRRVPYHNWSHGFCVANSAYVVIRKSGVFKPLEMLNNIKHCILATDLALFFPNRANLAAIVEEKKFDFDNSEHRLLLQAITMTACDLCGSTKSWEQQKEIVKVIFEEFYDQGDIEKSQGRQPIPIMDRNRMDEQPTSQVSFLKGICIPCYELLHTLIPETKPMLEGCKENLRIWESLAAEQEKNKTDDSCTDELNDEKEKTSCSKIM